MGYFWGGFFEPILLITKPLTTVSICFGVVFICVQKNKKKIRRFKKYGFFIYVTAKRKTAPKTTPNRLTACYTDSCDVTNRPKNHPKNSQPPQKPL